MGHATDGDDTGHAPPVCGDFPHRSTPGREACYGLSAMLGFEAVAASTTPSWMPTLVACAGILFGAFLAKKRIARMSRT